jgi:hypothetical protein
MNRFAEDEWAVVAGAPLLAAMWVLAGERGGLRGTLAIAGAYRAARDDYDTELLREVLTTAPAGAIERPDDREALRREAPASLRLARDIVERVGTAHERAEYRGFVVALAEAAARAAGSGGLLRRRRATRTDASLDALRSITAILDDGRTPHADI